MNKKKMQDIKIKKRKKRPVVQHTTIEIDKFVNKKTPKKKKRLSTPHIPQKRGFNRFLLILFILTIFSGVVFWSSVVFENVSIIITKKHQVFKLDKYPFRASKGEKVGIPFEVMITSDKKIETINLSDSKNVSLKAKGVITLYNKYSKNTQKISARTYISDSKGKVYLTDKTVSIPGYKIVNKKIVAGKRNVSITSFLPGVVYNNSREGESFTINGFKGTKKFENITGLSVGFIKGGALGLTYYPTKDDLDNLDESINSSFKDDLIKKVYKLIPSEYIFYPNASNFSYIQKEDISSDKPYKDIQITGTLTALILKKDQLINTILKNLLPKTPKEELASIKIKGLDSLEFNFDTKDQSITTDTDSYQFTITGNLDFIWSPNILKNEDSLLGIEKDNLTNIFKEDVGIDNASVKIFPPWQKLLPVKKSRINISVL